MATSLLSEIRADSATGRADRPDRGLVRADRRALDARPGGGGGDGRLRRGDRRRRSSGIARRASHGGTGTRARRSSPAPCPSSRACRSSSGRVRGRSLNLAKRLIADLEAATRAQLEAAAESRGRHRRHAAGAQALGRAPSRAGADPGRAARPLPRARLLRSTRAPRSSGTSTTSPSSTSRPSIRRATPTTPTSSTIASCCARTPRRDGCARWRSGSRRSGSCSRAACIAPSRSDASHIDQFHQIDGLFVDRNVSMAGSQEQR